MFKNKDDETALETMLQEWKTDNLSMKPAFITLKKGLEKNEKAILSFHARPGVTLSLRATVEGSAKNQKPLFTMIDIIDDDPENRWLSVCFFGEMISDPDEAGDFVPGGLLGEDAHCFDYDEPNGDLLAYINQRLEEAYAFMAAGK